MRRYWSSVGLGRRLARSRLVFTSLGTFSSEPECDDVTSKSTVESAAVEVEAEAKWVNVPKGELRVGAETDPGALGKAMEVKLRDTGKCEVRASGEKAIMRFVKGVAIARKWIVDEHRGDVHFRTYHSFWIDRNSPQQLLFCVERSQVPLDVEQDHHSEQKISVRKDTDMRQLGKSMRVVLYKSGYVTVLAIGTEAVVRSIVASTWSRRLALEHKRDIDCYASLQRPHRALHNGLTYVIALQMVERDASADSQDAKSLKALRPPPFYPPLEQLQSAEKAFSETLDVSLPIVKVRGETTANKAAATFVSFLRSCGGVQVFSSGSMANSQAVKAIAICRQYVREVQGYDLGLQCIHAPRDNRNGECQVVSWLRLMADASQRLSELEDDKVVFKVGNLNDAKSVGNAMATHLERSQLLDCISLGIAARARSLVALAHARLFLAPKQLDLVALPFFDDGVGYFDDRQQRCVRLRFDVLCVQK